MIISMIIIIVIIIIIIIIIIYVYHLYADRHDVPGLAAGGQDEVALAARVLEGEAVPRGREGHLGGRPAW